MSEKHVLAEEMYEEEEDELPAQYKNLNAHLHTGSEDFDARLQAYLANAVAFRKALSGVSKNRDKGKNVDFVNTRQLADHQALFPKHSDAWKDIVIPKAKETGSPYLPQGSLPLKRSTAIPYDTKSSSLLSRRLSNANNTPDSMDSMGTLKPSDLKPRMQSYRPVARHPSLPQSKVTASDTSGNPKEFLENAGINYASLNTESINAVAGSQVEDTADSPFSSRLPANAIDMLLPWNMKSMASPSTFDSALFDASIFHPKEEDTIDATLLAPRDSKKAEYPVTQSEYAPQSITSWNPMFKESSASRKLTEDNMWGTFIDESNTEAWEWPV